MLLENHPECTPFLGLEQTAQMTVYYEKTRNIVWLMLKGYPRPSFAPELLNELTQALQTIKQSELPIDYLVTGSLIPGIFNVGGDLELFVSAIRNKNEDKLRQYGEACVDLGLAVRDGLDRGVVSIAMIEGSALGGGFEAALSHNFIMAQHDAKMGFPEIDFNLFPGMGAFSHIARKAGMPLAEKLITTGEPKTAEWLAEFNIVDKTFEQGDGFKTVRTFVDKWKPKLNGLRGILKARHEVWPVSRAELIQITQDWATTAMSLPEKDLRYMERLVQIQNRKIAQLRVVA